MIIPHSILHKNIRSRIGNWSGTRSGLGNWTWSWSWFGFSSKSGSKFKSTT